MPKKCKCYLAIIDSALYFFVKKSPYSAQTQDIQDKRVMDLTKYTLVHVGNNSIIRKKLEILP